jgi:hypothetical protein
MENESFEPISGGGRFGNTFDDWGNRFICNIRNPAIQVLLDYDMLARNPFYSGPGAMFDSAEASDQLPIYRGDQYGPAYRGQAFLGEVANNVIYRQTLKRQGIQFRAERADQNVEFVASNDDDVSFEVNVFSNVAWPNSKTIILPTRLALKPLSLELVE